MCALSSQNASKFGHVSCIKDQATVASTMERHKILDKISKLRAVQQSGSQVVMGPNGGLSPLADSNSSWFHKREN